MNNLISYCTFHPRISKHFTNIILKSLTTPLWGRYFNPILQMGNWDTENFSDSMSYQESQEHKNYSLYILDCFLLFFLSHPILNSIFSEEMACWFQCRESCKTAPSFWKGKFTAFRLRDSAERGNDTSEIAATFLPKDKDFRNKTFRICGLCIKLLTFLPSMGKHDG